MEVITLAIGVAITVAIVLLAMALSGPLNRLMWRVFLRRSHSKNPSSVQRAGTAPELRGGTSNARSEVGSEGHSDGPHPADSRKN
jgi:hypothetical protein